MRSFFPTEMTASTKRVAPLNKIRDASERIEIETIIYGKWTHTL